MRLTYDLDQDRLIRGLRSPHEIPNNRIELKSANSGPVEWQFVRPLLAAESLATPLTLKFGIKPLKGFTADFLASNWDGTQWLHTLTGSGATAVYATPVTWDSEQLRTLLTAASVAGFDYVDFAGVLKISSASTVRETLNFTIRIFRSYITNLEGFPTAPNPDPDDFEQVIHKGEPDGYAPLDEDGLLPADHLPAGLPTASDLATLADSVAALANTTSAHAGNTNNPHGVTKAQVGLSSVDNTSDAAKPVSSETATALTGKADLVDGVVPSAQLPGSLALDTLSVGGVPISLASGGNISTGVNGYIETGETGFIKTGDFCYIYAGAYSPGDLVIGNGTGGETILLSGPNTLGALDGSALQIPVAGAISNGVAQSVDATGSDITVNGGDLRMNGNGIRSAAQISGDFGYQLDLSGSHLVSNGPINMAGNSLTEVNQLVGTSGTILDISGSEIVANQALNLGINPLYAGTVFASALQLAGHSLTGIRTTVMENFGSTIAANTATAATVSLTGALESSVVVVNTFGPSLPLGLVASARCSAPDEIILDVQNLSPSTVAFSNNFRITLLELA